MADDAAVDSTSAHRFYDQTAEYVAALIPQASTGLGLAAIGCIDFRFPSSINPRKYSSPLARWSARANPPSTSAANATRRGLTRSTSCVNSRFP